AVYPPSPTGGEGTARAPANSIIGSQKATRHHAGHSARANLEAFPFRRMFCIIAGLDPAVHLLTNKGWMRGSRMRLSEYRDRGSGGAAYGPTRMRPTLCRPAVAAL